MHREARRIKLLPPRRPTGAITRADLEERLEWAADLPLTLVIAHAGYGKTTLLSSWALRAPRLVAWLSLDALDSGLRPFTSNLIAAIRRVAPDAAPSMDDLLGGTRELTPDLIAQVLADDLLELPEELVLVIDDLHTVLDEEIAALLAALLRYPSPTLRLIVSSRIEPAGLPVERLIALGQAHIITEEDLRFTLEGTREALPEGSPLTAEEVLERTDGWAAGVRALSLARSSDAPLPESVRAYLAADVLYGLPTDMVALLRSVAVAERVSPALAVAMTERAVTHEEAARLLAIAERRGLFVTRLDDAGSQWRVHPLLRDVLKEELGREGGAEAIRRSHELASRWMAENGLMAEAVDQALAAELPDLAAELISTRVMDWLASDWTGSLDWVDRLPLSALRLRPELQLARAISLFTQSNLPAALAVCDEIDRELVRRKPGADPLFDNAIRWDVLQIRASMAHQGAPNTVTLDQLRELMDGPPGVRRQTRAYGVTQWAMRMTVNGRWAEARPEVERIARESLVDADDFAFQVCWSLAGLQLRELDLAACNQWLTLAERICESGHHELRSHWMANLRATFLFETGDPERAVAIARRTIPLSPGQFILPKSQMALMVARVLMDQRRFEDARAMILADRKRLEVSGALHLLCLSDAAEADLALAEGNRRAAYRWADMTPVRYPPDVLWTGEHPIQVQARIWRSRRAAGDVDQAIAALAGLRDHTIATAHLLGLARMLPLLAGAQAAAGDAAAARETMRAALEIEPGAMTHRFAKAGPDAGEVLAEIAMDSQDPLASRAARMLDMIGIKRAAAVPIEEDNPLTARQMSIVALMAQWKTDKEIAAELDISPYTVTEHVRNIMRRLNVSDRRSAVAAVIEAGWNVEGHAPGAGAGAGFGMGSASAKR
jgi:LuxR family maltose regulon positive regulatory protein